MSTARPYRIEHRSDGLSEQSAIDGLIKPYQQELQAEMNMEIGSCEIELTKNKPESSLGNWVADAVLSYAERHTGKKYDIGLCNYGGIRIPMLPPGPITKGKIYELMPFDNFLMILELNGH